MTRELLTGFEPFAGADTNASWDAVELMAREWDGDAEVVVRRLPVVFGRASRRLLEHVVAHTPDVVIATGLSSTSTDIAVERVAVNLRDTRVPDNEGRQPREEPVSASGPDAYFSTLPVRPIVRALQHAGLPARESLSAGTFVCNDTFYSLQRGFHGLAVRTGFIHLPPADALATSHAARALAIAVDIAATASAVRQAAEQRPED